MTPDRPMDRLSGESVVDIVLSRDVA
jgi:hypothetical protein